MIRRWKNEEQVQELWGLPVWAICEGEQAQKKDSLKNEGPWESGLAVGLYSAGNLKAGMVCQQASNVIRAKD